MGIEVKESLIHWNYFLALESDLAQVSRYIEFDKKNFRTYSIELAHLLLASSSEVDVIAKGICGFLEPKSSAENINQYREIINRNLPEFKKEFIYVPRFNIKLKPWDNWNSIKKPSKNPLWWSSYNKVKHERSEYFAEANLKNVLNSVSGLLVTIFYFYKLKFSVNRPQLQARDITQLIMPESEFVRLDESYYYSHLIV
ncbi:MAG: hypothetical protein HZB50_17140 [Chloroflexi bacterium]|nr:hypothetical protein [Chloroflexota bacterium]